MTLFLRPIIPGVTDREAEEIIRAASDAGVRTLVPGTLRVTRRILRRLRATRALPWRELEARLPGRLREGEQAPIRARDLKERVSRVAREYSMRVLPASCAANIESHGQACAACPLGPCGDPRKLPEVTEDGVSDLMEYLGLKPVRVEVRGYTVEYSYRGPQGKARVLRHLIIALARRTPKPRPPGQVGVRERRSD